MAAHIRRSRLSISLSSSGAAGIIDGNQYQYVVDIDTWKGSLKPLNEAQIWKLDRSAENPELAQQLRAIVASRFPELVQ
jgi:hypothetical protein